LIVSFFGSFLGKKEILLLPHKIINEHRNSLQSEEVAMIVQGCPIFLRIRYKLKASNFI
jgi:hypothetical protein